MEPEPRVRGVVLVRRERLLQISLFELRRLQPQRGIRDTPRDESTKHPCPPCSRQPPASCQRMTDIVTQHQPASTHSGFSCRSTGREAGRPFRPLRTLSGLPATERALRSLGIASRTEATMLSPPADGPGKHRRGVDWLTPRRKDNRPLLVQSLMARRATFCLGLDQHRHTRRATEYGHCPPPTSKMSHIRVRAELCRGNRGPSMHRRIRLLRSCGERRHPQPGQPRLRRDLPAARGVRRRGDRAGRGRISIRCSCPTPSIRVDTVTGAALEFVGAAGIGGFISGAVERFEFFELVILNVHVMRGPDGHRRPVAIALVHVRAPPGGRERPLDQRVRRVPRRPPPRRRRVALRPPPIPVARAHRPFRGVPLPRDRRLRVASASARGAWQHADVRCCRVRSSALRHAGRALRRRSGGRARRARPGRGRRRAGRRAARAEAAAGRRRPHARRRRMLADAARSRCSRSARRRGAPSSAPRSSTACAAGRLSVLSIHSATDSCYAWDEYGAARRAPASTATRGRRRSSPTCSTRRIPRARTSAPSGRGTTRCTSSAICAPTRRCCCASATASSISTRPARARRRSAIRSRGASREGHGRVFSTSLGHFPGAWETPAYLRHLSGGLGWALGSAA